jgi:proteasome lid subunit RPN8/RPN11
MQLLINKDALQKMQAHAETDYPSAVVFFMVRQKIFARFLLQRKL